MWGSEGSIFIFAISICLGTFTSHKFAQASSLSLREKRSLGCKAVGNTVGMTFGPNIYIRDAKPKYLYQQLRLIHHEIEHYNQWRRLGGKNRKFAQEYFYRWCKADPDPGPDPNREKRSEDFLDDERDNLGFKAANEELDESAKEVAEEDELLKESMQETLRNMQQKSGRRRAKGSRPRDPYESTEEGRKQWEKEFGDLCNGDNCDVERGHAPSDPEECHDTSEDPYCTDTVGVCGLGCSCDDTSEDDDCDDTTESTPPPEICTDPEDADECTDPVGDVCTDPEYGDDCSDPPYNPPNCTDPEDSDDCNDPDDGYCNDVEGEDNCGDIPPDGPVTKDPFWRA